MRLRTKYVLVLLAVLLVLGTVVVGTAELFKTQTIEREQSDLDRQTQIAAQQVDEAVADQTTLLNRYAADINLSDPGQSEQVLGRLTNNTDFLWAAIVDKNGTVVDIRGAVTEAERKHIGSPVGETSLAGDRNATLTLKDGRSQISSPKPIAWATGNEEGQSHILNYTVSINDRDSINGALIGSVVLWETDFFDAVAPLSTSTEAARIVGQTPNGEQTTLEGTNSSFADPIRSSAVVETTGWTLEVQRDRAELTEQLQFLQFIQFGSLVVVLVSMLGLGFYQYRTTLQQTDRLLVGFDELTEGNFDHSMDLAAAEEWTQISDGFNTMADGLRERERQIRERERQIRERERRLSVLNRVLRHNLQNDMSVIQGFAQVIPDAESRDRREELSDRIVEKSRKLVDHGQKARYLEELMENAEDGPVEMDLTREVDQVVADARSAYPDVTIETEMPDEAWGLAVPRSEAGIESVVENACEHNDSDEPHVSVTVEDRDDIVVIRVRDNGPGIPDHERDVLRQDEETSLEHGSGIGLWLAYWAAIKSDGDLQFDEPAAGGALVAICFPSCERPEDAGEVDDLLSI